MGSKKNKRPRKDKSRFFDPLSVTWAEKYDKVFTKIWKILPHSVGKCIATIATFIVGISINGDWLSILVHARKQFGYISTKNGSDSKFQLDTLLESLRLSNFLPYWIGSCAVSYSLYFIIGGFLHWYYYVRQRDRAEEWKCQPKKWLSPELERHEIILGSSTLLLNSTIAGTMACYIANGGYSTIYYEVSDYGWPWFFLQIVLLFVYQDYATYWLHRIYHFPFLYKNFHKLHHKYKQPTAFSVTAIHPVESVHIQLTLTMPIFIIPMHWAAFYGVVCYNYYHGIIDHSGINFKSYWWQPWQPDAIFHDNHHQYFHVNFAFNMEIWDKIHGTYRQKDRVYHEDVFYGKGKSLNEITAKELQTDLAERSSENPLAYRKNKLEYKLSKDVIKNLKVK